MDAMNRLTESCRKTFCGISSDNIVMTSLNIRSLDTINFSKMAQEVRHMGMKRGADSDKRTTFLTPIT